MLGSKESRRKIRYQLVYGLVKSLISISNALPRNVWLAFCGVLGSLAYYFTPATRKLTIKHLHMAFPEKSDREILSLAKRSFKMLGKNSGEVLRSTGMENFSEIEKFMVTHGYENF